MSVRASRFVHGLIALTTLCTLLRYGVSLFPLLNVFAFLYPAYFSVLAIENANKKEKMKWLMYWVIYGTIAITECVAGIFLRAFPAIRKLKTIFLLWCMAPVDWNGSQTTYTAIIRPFFYKQKPMFEELSRKASEAVDDIKPEVYSTTNESIATSTPKGSHRGLWFWGLAGVRGNQGRFPAPGTGGIGPDLARTVAHSPSLLQADPRLTVTGPLIRRDAALQREPMPPHCRCPT
ncbi:receptor expression-enhancing protein 5-like isoform X1 [Narcine bancroftii]|uniref:receptor expression-enhancing protein 5-like isoform X1 n=1 Tax=Narcine bancroftii TaxID=1343680 RepID=UPI003831FECD